MSSITIKRLHKEFIDLNKNKSELFQIVPVDNDIFTYYFLLAGLDRPYKGGYYLGKLLLPQNYPMQAGDIEMLTPNGRFGIGGKICLSNTAFHPESFTPMWTLRTSLLGFASIFMDYPSGINHIKESDEERRIKAAASVSYNIEKYPKLFCKFDQFVNPDFTLKSNEEILKSIGNPVIVKPTKIKSPKITLEKPYDKYKFIDFIDYFKNCKYNNVNLDIYDFFQKNF